MERVHFRFLDIYHSTCSYQDQTTSTISQNIVVLLDIKNVVTILMLSACTCSILFNEEATVPVQASNSKIMMTNL